jgi:GNAT superfamily N-acetyltransferase
MTAKSVMYNYVRSRQLEGTYPGSAKTGIWPITSFRVMKGWGCVDEKIWPFDGDESHWPPKEPENIDIHAKALRIYSYQRVNSINECRESLAKQHPISAAFEIDDSWLHAPDGIVSSPKSQSIIGSHTVDLIGYSDIKQQFTFRNSWGTKWGDAGYGYLPYSYITDRYVEGWTIPVFLSPVQEYEFDALGFSKCRVKDIFGRHLYVTEVIDKCNDEILAWGFVIEYSTYLEMEELFVRPKWRKRGYASEIATDFLRLAEKLGKSIRVLISHADHEPKNILAITAIFKRLGISYKSSTVRWATAIGE